MMIWWPRLCLINSTISAWCPDRWLQLSEYRSQVGLNNHSLACGWCWLLSAGIVLGVRTTKNIPQYQYYAIPMKIAQYPITQYQYCSNPTCSSIHWLPAILTSACDISSWSILRLLLLLLLLLFLMMLSGSAYLGRQVPQRDEKFHQIHIVLKYL